MIKAKIELLLTQAFKPTFLQVIDESHKHAGHAGASTRRALSSHYYIKSF